MTTRIPAPPYGSVESFTQILKHTKPEYIEVAALALVEMIADERDYDDALKIGRIRNVVTAVAMVHDAPPADPIGLGYTRADDDAEDPTPTGPREPLHTGASLSGIAEDGHKMGAPGKPVDADEFACCGRGLGEAHRTFCPDYVP